MSFNNSGKKGLNSEINMTPFVDIVLVLLVIFMISAPLMLNGIKLKLPKTKKVSQINLNKDQVILSYSAAGDLFIGKEKYLEDEIIKVIKERMQELKVDVLFLRADYLLKYGKVAKLISQLKRQGVSNIALVTEIETKI